MRCKIYIYVCVCICNIHSTIKQFDSYKNKKSKLLINNMIGTVNGREFTNKYLISAARWNFI